MYYLIGLGNPGEKYQNTPHNAGRDICGLLLRDWGCPSDALYQNQAVKVVGCGDFRLVFPRTYMNRSGDALRALESEEKLDADRVIVLHDDIDLPLGTLKISRRKGSAGHRGVESVMRVLGTDEFVRFRIGIAPVDEMGIATKPKGTERVTSYVLHKLSEDELATLRQLVPQVGAALTCLREEGVGKAMSLYNVLNSKK